MARHRESARPVLLNDFQFLPCKTSDTGIIFFAQRFVACGNSGTLGYGLDGLPVLAGCDDFSVAVGLPLLSSDVELTSDMVTFSYKVALFRPAVTAAGHFRQDSGCQRWLQEERKIVVSAELTTPWGRSSIG